MPDHQVASRNRAKLQKSSASHPLYLPGTVRMRRWYGQGDVRAHLPASGWSAQAVLVDIHPISGLPLPKSEWWIVETKL